MRDGKWEYTIRAYYPSNAKSPKIPNGLAIETVHIGKTSRDIEIEAFKSRMARHEIGYIEVIAHIEPFDTIKIFS